MGWVGGCVWGGGGGCAGGGDALPPVSEQPHRDGRGAAARRRRHLPPRRAREPFLRPQLRPGMARRLLNPLPPPRPLFYFTAPATMQRGGVVAVGGRRDVREGGGV